MNVLFQGINLYFTFTYIIIFAGFILIRVPLAKWGSSFVSIGILGTFVGVYIALEGFNPEDIDNSVPILLNGMRTAFGTSIVGMLIALIAKIVEIISDVNEKNKNSKIADQGKFINIFRDQNEKLLNLVEIKKESRHLNENILILIDLIKYGNKENLRTYEDLKMMLTNMNNNMIEQLRIGNKISDGNTKLVSEVNGMRVEVNGMRVDLNNFIGNVSKESSKVIVDALKDIIENFNSKLTDQFGENFKQLNLAVGQMVIWLDLHDKTLKVEQNILQQATNNIENNSKNIENISKSFKEISNEVLQVSERLESFKTLMNVLGSGGVEMNRISSQLVEIYQVMKEAQMTMSNTRDIWNQGINILPKSITSVQNMIQEIANSSNKITDHSKNIGDTYIALSGKLETHSKSIGDTYIALSGKLETHSKSIGTTYEVSTRKITNHYNQLEKIMHLMVKITSDFQGVATASETINKNMKNNSEEINSFLYRSIEDIQSSYTKLGNKMTTDLNVIHTNHHKLLNEQDEEMRKLLIQKIETSNKFMVQRLIAMIKSYEEKFKINAIELKPKDIELELKDIELELKELEDLED